MGMKRLWSLLKIYDLMIIALLVLSAYNLSAFGFSVIPSMLAVVLAAVFLDIGNFVSLQSNLRNKEMELDLGRYSDGIGFR